METNNIFFHIIYHSFNDKTQIENYGKILCDCANAYTEVLSKAGDLKMINYTGNEVECSLSEEQIKAIFTKHFGNLLKEIKETQNGIQAE